MTAPQLSVVEGIRAAQTPIAELLARVPADARLIYEHSPTHSQSIQVGRLAADALAIIQSQAAEIERMRPDADRYRLLRMYAVNGYWPREFQHNPGVLAFTANYDDPRKYTLGNLDALLDEMLGVGVTDEKIKERNWRADYREYKAEKVRLVFSQVYPDAILTTTQPKG